MKIGITYGTYDMFHIGHLNLIERAAQQCDRLYVGVSTDQFNEIKGKKAFQNYEIRSRIVGALGCVHAVFPENHWTQKRDDFKRYQAHTFFMGDDWAGKFDEFKDVVDVVYLDRTRDISSTELRNNIRARVREALSEISKAGLAIEDCLKLIE